MNQDLFGIINAPEVSVNCEESYRQNDQGQALGLMEDQALYGNAIRVLREEADRFFIMSAYGYAGYVDRDDVLLCSKAELDKWLGSNLMVSMAFSTDVLTAPTVEGKKIATLPRGSLLAVEEELDNGWYQIRMADKTVGFVPAVRMGIKRYDEAYLYEDVDSQLEIIANSTSLKETEVGGKADFSLKNICDRWFNGDEDRFRESLVDTARMYMGCQYRWGGRSSFGLDCSGLVSMSYLFNGIIVYRDAKIVKNYPLKKLDYKKTQDGHIDESCFLDGTLKIGDTLYFPGHIAMYIGEGRYIHSTGYKVNMGVTINSLIPTAADFRQDLYDKLYAVAGVR